MSGLAPRGEAERLAALRRYEILDTLPEQVFDDLTLLAAQICEAPIALVTLIDEERQWFKSKIGLTVAETSRDVALRAHAIIEPELLIVRDATPEPSDAAIVTAIITLVHSLSLKVIAEGAETVEHLRFLRLLRCDVMQGFVFSKPLPAEDFARLLQKGEQLIW